MKNSIYFLIIILVFSFLSINCNSDDDGSTNTIYKQYMRSFVQSISAWAKAQQLGFIIIPQNGHELATVSGNENDEELATDYITAIDGAGQEDLFYGYDNDDIITPEGERDYLLSFLNIYENNEVNKVEVLVTDYCWTVSNVNASYQLNNDNNFISFAADRRELDKIPVLHSGLTPYEVQALVDINSLSEAKNFLYLLDPTTNYGSAAAFIAAIDATNYDVFIIDLFYDGTELTPANITSLQTKPGGNSRLVICYMSIGEAEDYRYYWDSDWETDPPDWLEEENPDWEGNYKVQYWDSEWRDIIYGNNSSYLDKIIDAGFDGVYLDIIDAWEYFE